MTVDNRAVGAHTDIAEVYIFEFTAGRISRAWAWRTPGAVCASSG
jgi:hypothetical protein